MLRSIKSAYSVKNVLMKIGLKIHVMSWRKCTSYFKNQHVLA